MDFAADLCVKATCVGAVWACYGCTRCCPDRETIGGIGMFRKRQPQISLQTPRCTLRLPEMGDHLAWVEQRQNSAEFLKEWEPVWSPDHFSKRAFQNRVYWAGKDMRE